MQLTHFLPAELNFFNFHVQTYTIVFIMQLENTPLGF